MAITACPEFRYPFYLDPNLGSGAIGLTSTTISQSVIPYFAVMVRCPKAGTLDRFEFLTANVANNPDNGLRLSFQDVDAAGVPDGTADQYRVITGTISSNTWQVPGTMTNDGTDLGTKRTVTKDEMIACVIGFENPVSGDSVSIALQSTISNWSGMLQSYMATGNTTPTWTKTATDPIIALFYDDGTIAELTDTTLWPISTVTQSVFGSSSTPDEYAMRFQIPFSMRASGLWVRADFDNAADVILYDNSNTSLGSFSVNSALQRASSPGITTRRFSSDVTLSANTTYRIAVKPTSTSTITISNATVPSNAYLGTVFGTEWYMSTRTDAGSWTDDDNAFFPAGLLVNGIDITASSGGGGSFTFIG